MPSAAGGYSSFPGGSTPGIFPDPIDVQVTVRGGNVAVGDVVQLDLTGQDAATTSAARGNSASIFANTITPLASAITGICAGSGVAGLPQFGVALTAALDDATCMVRLSGVVSAFCIKAGGTDIAAFDTLTVSTSKNLTFDGAEGDTYHAIALAVVTAPTTRTLASVYFDGSGLGRKGSGSYVTTTGTQTLTNKTLTSPTLTGGTLSAVTLDANSTIANGVTLGNAAKYYSLTKSGLTDNVAAASFLISVQDEVHASTIRVTAVGGLGDGDSTQSKVYTIALSRITGANAKAVISGAEATGLTTGATGNATVTVALSAVAGAVGAENTFDIQITVARSAGAADNHFAALECVVLTATGTPPTLAAI
jgi:hypothetical protein